MPAEILHLQEEDRPQHECGLGLLYTFEPQYLQSDLLKIGDALQHRGQNGAGIATDSGFRVTGSGLLHDAIDKHDLESEGANRWAMIHLRYGTSGGYSSENMQPVEVEIEGQKVHIAVNGNIPNPKRLRAYCPEITDPDVSDTVLAAHTLAKIEGETFDDRIRTFADLPEIAESANNMIIGSGSDAYVVRDQFGVHPMVVGSYHEGKGIVVASETVAFQKLGAQVMGEFPPGAILKITPEGTVLLRQGTASSNHQKCIFEPAYFSGPNSRFPTYEGQPPEEWLSVGLFRSRTGEIAAAEAPVPHADFVVGMPDSGVPFATGLANGMGKPYFPWVIRSHYNGEEKITRTFMQDEHMEGIAALVRGKLMPIDDPRIWEDKVVVIGDDSLVRGNTAREVTRMLRSLGVREIHWRLGFPPVQNPCHLGVSFRSLGELLAVEFDNDWEKMAEYLGADSVAFISHKGILQAAKECKEEDIIIPENPKEIYMANGYCGGCTTGVYPVMPEGTIYRSSKKTLALDGVIR